MAAHKLTLNSKFWKHVLVEPNPTGCWKWVGAPSPDGYGRVKDSGRNIPAHRVSWELHYGPIPEGLLVLHHCDNPECTRPDHLFLGTCVDNVRDRDRKKRQSMGDAHYNARLTSEDVRHIRKLRKWWSVRILAEYYNVCIGHVYRIGHKEKWRSV